MGFMCSFGRLILQEHLLRLIKDAVEHRTPNSTVHPRFCFVKLLCANVYRYQPQIKMALLGTFSFWLVCIKDFKEAFSDCRMIQVERESAELRADEIESRVNSGSMDGLNVTLRPRSTIPTSVTALSLASSSPPVSGRSTPKTASRSTAHELGVMTLVRNDESQHCACTAHCNRLMGSVYFLHIKS